MANENEGKLSVKKPWFLTAPIVQRPRMRPFHGRDPSSNLGRGVFRNLQKITTKLINKTFFGFL